MSDIQNEFDEFINRDAFEITYSDNMIVQGLCVDPYHETFPFRKKEELEIDNKEMVDYEQYFEHNTYFLRDKINLFYVYLKENRNYIMKENILSRIHKYYGELCQELNEKHELSCNAPHPKCSISRISLCSLFCERIVRRRFICYLRQWRRGLPLRRR